MIYETLYIIPSRISDTDIERVQKRVEEIVIAAGAKVEQHEVLQKIKLAYPIKGEQHGTYALLYTESPAEALSKIDSAFKLEGDILRAITVKREEGIPKHRFQLSSYQPPITPEGKRPEKRRVEQTRPRPAAKPDEKLSMEELDKKLDEILESDVVKGV